MRTGNPDLYARPGGRTEAEVAAEVCVRILEGGLVANLVGSGSSGVGNSHTRLGTPLEPRVESVHA
jgi:hypothetical protein